MLLRYLALYLNLLILGMYCGVTLFTGFATLRRNHHVKSLTTIVYDQFMISTGILLLIGTVCGILYGIEKYHKPLTFCFGLSMLSIFCSVLSISMIFCIKRQIIVSLLAKKLRNDIDTNNSLIARLQESYKCCGATGLSDYQNLFPGSCCKGGKSCSKLNSYDQGCAKRFLDFLGEHHKLVVPPVVITCFITLAGLLIITGII